jgi:hypothetical protein
MGKENPHSYDLLPILGMRLEPLTLRAVIEALTHIRSVRTSIRRPLPLDHPGLNITQ